jgi:hypothetical protein
MRKADFTFLYAARIGSLKAVLRTLSTFTPRVNQLKFAFSCCVLRRKIKHCQELDLSYTLALYKRIPLRVFEGRLYLDLQNTAITSNLHQIANKSHCLQYLNVSNCPLLKEDFLLYGKKYFEELLHLDISYNPNFSIIGLACVCSYEEMCLIHAYGMKLSPKECLFLLKTFEYPLATYRMFRRELNSC